MGCSRCLSPSLGSISPPFTMMLIFFSTAMSSDFLYLFLSPCKSVTYNIFMCIPPLYYFQKSAFLIIPYRGTTFSVLLCLLPEIVPHLFPLPVISVFFYQNHMNKSGLRSYSHRPGPLYLISISCRICHAPRQALNEQGRAVTGCG